MPTLTLAQIVIDLPKGLKAAPQLSHEGRNDHSLLAKTVLTESFGGPVLRPWRIIGKQGRQLTVLGYTQGLDTGGLRQRLAHATPALQQALKVIGNASVLTPVEGEMLRFQLRCVPLVSVTHSRRSRDAYSYARSRWGTAAGIDRAAIYAAYVRDRLAGADLEAFALDNFERVLMVRRQGSAWSTKRYPKAELSGRLRVTDPAAFTQTLAAGLGRMRAYGFGMLRLEAV